ncbi:MAG: PD-(D/E)XK nuclease family protein [Acidimicrobiales bacterium]
MATVAEIVARPVAPDHPGASSVAQLRGELERQLADVTRDWDRAGGPLGVTKSRMLAAVRCPASVIAETTDLALSTPLVVGAVVDTAAAMLLMSDKVPGPAPWLGALMPVLAQTEPDQARYIEDLSVESRHELREIIEQKGRTLVRLLGDVRSLPGTAQEMFRVEFADSGVLLTGRTDLVLGRGARSVIEVKSGAVRPAHVDEAGFYALLAALRDGVAPQTTVVVTLDPGTVTEYPVTLDSLEASAQRMIGTARPLVEIDQAVAVGEWPATNPSDFCAWCGVVQECPDAPDLARAEAEAAAESPELDDGEDEPW